jgi:hypothetical protein
MKVSGIYRDTENEEHSKSEHAEYLTSNQRPAATDSRKTDIFATQRDKLMSFPSNAGHKRDTEHDKSRLNTRRAYHSATQETTPDPDTLQIGLELLPSPCMLAPVHTVIAVAVAVGGRGRGVGRGGRL